MQTIEAALATQHVENRQDAFDAYRSLAISFASRPEGSAFKEEDRALVDMTTRSLAAVGLSEQDLLDDVAALRASAKIEEALPDLRKTAKAAQPDFDKAILARNQAALDFRTGTIGDKELTRKQTAPQRLALPMRKLKAAEVQLEELHTLHSRVFGG